MSERLETMREDMDALNQALLEAFLMRMAHSRKIIRYKASKGAAMYDPGREDAIVDAMADAASPEEAPYVRRLFREVLSLCRAYSQDDLPRNP